MKIYNNNCIKSEKFMRNLTRVNFTKLTNSKDDRGESKALSRVKQTYLSDLKKTWIDLKKDNNLCRLE